MEKYIKQRGNIKKWRWKNGKATKPKDAGYQDSEQQDNVWRKKARRKEGKKRRAEAGKAKRVKRSWSNCKIERYKDPIERSDPGRNLLIFKF